jgi:hypothetical protein
MANYVPDAFLPVPFSPQTLTDPAWAKQSKKWGNTRIELATSRTLSENHTTRPIALSCENSMLIALQVPTYMYNSLGWCSWLSRVPHTHEVTSSILVSSTFFAFVSVDGRKFGRVVKAVALGAILVRGRGSNPLACIIFFFPFFRRKTIKLIKRSFL